MILATTESNFGNLMKSLKIVMRIWSLKWIANTNVLKKLGFYWLDVSINLKYLFCGLVELYHIVVAIFIDVQSKLRLPIDGPPTLVLGSTQVQEKIICHVTKHLTEASCDVTYKCKIFLTILIRQIYKIVFVFVLHRNKLLLGHDNTLYRFLF